MSGNAHKRSDSKETAAGREKVKWLGYVNWNMSAVDKKAYLKWLEDQDVLYNVVPTIIGDGYSVKLAYDDYHDSVVCSLFCQNPGSENAGWCLTARAADPFEAMSRAMFIHFVCFDRIWPTERELDPDGWQ